MSEGDILLRADLLVNKYGKYDEDEEAAGREKAKAKGKGGSFHALLTQLEGDVEALAEKAREVEAETNRAAVATMNAELRRGKNTLAGEVRKLKKLAHKKGKGVTKEVVAERMGLVKELVRSIEAIPDGVSSSVKKFNAKKGGMISLNEIRIDELGAEASTSRARTMERTDQSKAFEEEWRQRKAKQEEGLDVIEKGLSTLKNMSEDIGDELRRQKPLINTIENKVDMNKATLQTNNDKLKEMVTKLRSSRNFCVDIVLLCILLSIGAYIYSLVK